MSDVKGFSGIGGRDLESGRFPTAQMFGLRLRLGPLGGEGGSGVIQHSGLGGDQRFAAVGQPLVEDAHVGVAAGGGSASHVEHLARAGPPAADMASATGPGPNSAMRLRRLARSSTQAARAATKSFSCWRLCSKGRARRRSPPEKWTFQLWLDTRIDITAPLGDDGFDTTSTQLLRCRICRNLNCPPLRSHFIIEEFTNYISYICNLSGGGGGN